MRTHWEVSVEDKQVRDQWDADFEARVQCNEKKAVDYWDGLSKKEKDWERGWMLGEHRKCGRGDGMFWSKPLKRGLSDWSGDWEQRTSRRGSF